MCTFGENCIYSHDRENSTEIPPDVCLFHLSSFCYHGTVCERRHLSVEQILSGNNVDDTVEPITDNETTIPSTKFLLPRFTQLSLRNVEDNCDGNASASTPKSYASAVCSNAILAPVEQSDAANKLLCSFFMSNGYCMLPDCSNVHGNLCDLCSYFALHPYNETERQKHRDVITDYLSYEHLYSLYFVYQFRNVSKSMKNRWKFRLLFNVAKISHVESVWKLFSKKNLVKVVDLVY